MKYKKHFIPFFLLFFIISTSSMQQLNAIEMNQHEYVNSVIEKIKQISTYQLIGVSVFIGFFSFFGYKFFGKLTDEIVEDKKGIFQQLKKLQQGEPSKFRGTGRGMRRPTNKPGKQSTKERTKLIEGKRVTLLS